MKKIGIISDTHGLLRPEILKILKDCDCIIHAGDVNKPEILDTLRMMGSIYVVRGNNDKDWAEGIAKTLYFTIEGLAVISYLQTKFHTQQGHTPISSSTGCMSTSASSMIL